LFFLDTSSLFKLYQYEIGTDILDKLFEENEIDDIILSELSKIEFKSIVWKKIRMKEFSISEGNKFLEMFKNDYLNYRFIEIKKDIIDLSLLMIEEFGQDGLRTLDSIQLATAYKHKNIIDLGISADKLLNSFIERIGISTL